VSFTDEQAAILNAVGRVRPRPVVQLVIKQIGGWLPSIPQICLLFSEGGGLSQVSEIGENNEVLSIFRSHPGREASSLIEN
jgi:hypothetical protein